MFGRIKALIMRMTDRRPITKCNVVSLAPNDLLKGRRALITGGTSGIGYSIAEAFLNAGASVVITGRNEERLQKACSRLSSKGICQGLVLDNTKVDTFNNAFKQITDGGRIDILVNNAGVNYQGMPNVKEEEYDLVLDTNLKGVFFLSQMVGKYMVSNGIKGNILNICSSSSQRPAISAYTVSKWGLRGLTLGLAKSLVMHGITVNGLAPGAVATPMLHKSGDEDMTYPSSPIGRYILPEEIANMAVFLVSDMGHSIVGDIVYMTGGMGVITYDDMNYNIFTT